MDNRTENIIKLMEKLGADIEIPEEFRKDTPDEEGVYEWDELGGDMNET